MCHIDVHHFKGVRIKICYLNMTFSSVQFRFQNQDSLRLYIAGECKRKSNLSVSATWIDKYMCDLWATFPEISPCLLKSRHELQLVIEVYTLFTYDIMQQNKFLRTSRWENVSQSRTENSLAQSSNRPTLHKSNKALTFSKNNYPIILNDIDRNIYEYIIMRKWTQLAKLSNKIFQPW